jgi:hypothetical protein
MENQLPKLLMHVFLALIDYASLAKSILQMTLILLTNLVLLVKERKVEWMKSKSKSYGRRRLRSA